MESVYFYEEDVGKEINGIVQRDFKNIPSTIKECELLGYEHSGYFLYVRSRSEPTDRMEARLKSLGIRKVLGEEKKAVCRAVIADEIELGALGFQTMFKKGRPVEEF